MIRLLGLCLFFVTIACSSEQSELEQELTEHYHKSLQRHLLEVDELPENPVFFLGDSLTEAMPLDQVTQRGVNYGISQDTTYGLKKRLEQYAHIDNAEAVFICIGINDFWRGRDNDGIVENVEAIIQRLPKNKPIFLNGVLPVEEVNRWIGWPKRIIELNKRLEQLAQKYDISYIDVHTKMADKEGELKSDFHNGDGVHLTQQGYKEWTAIIRDAMKQRDVSL